MDVVFVVKPLNYDIGAPRNEENSYNPYTRQACEDGRENERAAPFSKTALYESVVVTLLYLLIGVLLLVLVIGMQVQMRSMIRKLDELTEVKDTSEE